MKNCSKSTMVRTLDREEPHYFGAGPALLPTDVLQEAAYDLVKFQNETVGIGELSHRSAPAVQVIEDTKENLKKLLEIPDTHEVFFLQGGGTTGFSSIPCNLIASHARKSGKKAKAAYAVTGSWSEKSVAEARRLGFDVEEVVNTKRLGYNSIPPYSEWKSIDGANTAYLFVCDNETVNGTEFGDVPGSDYLPDNVELVADMSSNILSKKIDVSKYGLIMAGAQKNIGVAGLTVYIIKKSLLDQPTDQEILSLGIPVCPIAFHYPSAVKTNSTYNTIPIFTCHILKLVTEKLLTNGGLSQIEKVNGDKARRLYHALEKYPGFYLLAVSDPKARSRMNVVFNLQSPKLEAEFLQQASNKGFLGLKGHRSVGGIRASLYNAVTSNSVDLLVRFVEEFAESHQ